MAAGALAAISGAPSFGSGQGSSLGNDQDTLQSRSSGEASQSSPFTFNGGGSPTVGGSVPAWVIGAAIIGLVIVFGRKGRG